MSTFEFPAPADPAQVTKWLKTLHTARASKAKKRDAREQLILHHSRLAISLAHKQHARNRDHDVDDLIQTSLESVCKAIDAAKPDTPPSTLSSFVITVVTRSLIDRHSLPPSTQVHIPKMVAYELMRTVKTGKQPAYLLAPARNAINAVSIDDDSQSNNEDDPITFNIADENADTENDALDAVQREQLRALVCTLEPLEREIIWLSFGFETGHPVTMIDIAARLGMSPAIVSKLHGSALANLALEAGDLFR